MLKIADGVCKSEVGIGADSVYVRVAKTKPQRGRSMFKIPESCLLKGRGIAQAILDLLSLPRVRKLMSGSTSE